MISRPMARRSPRSTRAARGATFVQVVVVCTLLAIAIGGMTYAFFGQLSPLFGQTDKNLAGSVENKASNEMSQDSVTGHSASDPNAMSNSMQQQSTQNSQAAAKAKGTP